jgi:hypothetical protein
MRFFEILSSLIRIIQIGLAIGSIAGAAIFFATSYAKAQEAPYGAVATAMWQDSYSGMWREAGVVRFGETLDAAKLSALTACQAVTFGHACQIVGDGFHHGGCGYVTTGKRWDGLISMGVGSTPYEATASCENGGYVCNVPDGGCTSSSSEVEGPVE